MVLGLALTGAVTQFTKITVGRPRPGRVLIIFSRVSATYVFYLDILDRCQLSAGIVDPPFKLTNSTVCTQTDIAILRDGFRSFPSGHSSCEY